MSSFAGITMCSNSIFQIGKYQGFLSLSPSPSLALVVSFLVSHGKFSGLSRALWISRSLSFNLSLLISVSRAPALSISISLFLSLALFLSRNLSFTALRSLRVSFFSYLCLFLYYLSLSLSLFLCVSLRLSNTHACLLSFHFPSPLCLLVSLSFSLTNRLQTHRLHVWVIVREAARVYARERAGHTIRLSNQKRAD